MKRKIIYHRQWHINCACAEKGLHARFSPSCLVRPLYPFNRHALWMNPRQVDREMQRIQY
jgi:hypothetical protein